MITITILGGFLGALALIAMSVRVGWLLGRRHESLCDECHEPIGSLCAGCLEVMQAVAKAERERNHG